MMLGRAIQRVLVFGFLLAAGFVDHAAAQSTFDPISPGGSSTVTLTIATSGQTGNATFSGTAGQRVFLQLTNGTFAWGRVSIRKPDGGQLAGTWVAMRLMPRAA